MEINTDIESSSEFLELKHELEDILKNYKPCKSPERLAHDLVCYVFLFKAHGIYVEPSFSQQMRLLKKLEQRINSLQSTIKDIQDTMPSLSTSLNLDIAFNFTKGKIEDGPQKEEEVVDHLQLLKVKYLADLRKSVGYKIQTFDDKPKNRRSVQDLEKDRLAEVLVTVWKENLGKYPPKSQDSVAATLLSVIYKSLGIHSGSPENQIRSQIEHFERLDENRSRVKKSKTDRPE